MADKNIAAPDPTAVRVALWRALHMEVDPPPHVIADDLGLALASPEPGWRDRPDMHPNFTRPFRASIVARARFIEDLVAEQAGQGAGQYVILGAGLDTFAERKPDLAAGLRIFEVDQPRHQVWKRQQLMRLGYDIPEWLHLVPVDFESGESWWDKLRDAGLNLRERTVIACTGVSMYLSRGTVTNMLREIASLPPGSTLALTFLLPLEMADPEARPGLEMAAKGARANGTPFISFFTPPEMLALARDVGFKRATHVSADDLASRYFTARADGLRPPRNAEEFLIATT